MAQSGVRTLMWKRLGADVLRYVCIDGLEANMAATDCTTPYFEGNVLTREVEDWMARFGRTFAAGAYLWGRR